MIWSYREYMVGAGGIEWDHAEARDEKGKTHSNAQIRIVVACKLCRFINYRSPIPVELL